MKTAILVTAALMLLIGCAPVDPGRPRNATEVNLAGNTYVSNSDPVRSIEFSSTGSVAFKGICKFTYAAWWVSEPPNYGTGYYLLNTHSLGYVLGGNVFPGYNPYCDPKDGKDKCPQIKDICVKDTFPPVFTMSGTCITLQDTTGSTEQFCK